MASVVFYILALNIAAILAAPAPEPCNCEDIESNDLKALFHFLSEAEIKGEPVLPGVLVGGCSDCQEYNRKKRKVVNENAESEGIDADETPEVVDTEKLSKSSSEEIDDGDEDSVPVIKNSNCPIGFVLVDEWCVNKTVLLMAKK